MAARTSRKLGKEAEGKASVLGTLEMEVEVEVEVEVNSGWTIRVRELERDAGLRGLRIVGREGVKVTSHLRQCIQRCCHLQPLDDPSPSRPRS